VQGAVRLALPREREKRAPHERRLASACRRPAVPDPRAARLPRLRQRIQRRLVCHPRGDRGMVPEEPPHAHFMTSQSPAGMYDPATHRMLSFHDVAAKFRDGSDTPRAYLERCIERIEALEPAVMAFAFLNLERARK